MDKTKIWDFIINNEIATEDELQLITNINGYNKEALNIQKNSSLATIDKNISSNEKTSATIDKNIKRTPIEKRAEWAHEPMSPPPKKEDGWLGLFNGNKKKQPGWNKKKEEATILTRIKKFFKFK